MMLRRKTKDNPAKGCVLSLATLLGMILLCFVFCTVVFQLNQASTGGAELTGFLWLFGG